MDKEEKCLKENILFNGHIVDFHNDDVLTPLGHRVTREYISHPGGVCCLCFDEGYIYFVKQFRYPFHKEILELPAGKLEKNEDPIEAIKRELVEEIGFISNDIKSLGKILPSVGCSNEIIYLYISLDNTKTSTNPDEDELLDIVKLTPEEAYKLLDNNEIEDAKTVAILEKARKVFFN